MARTAGCLCLLFWTEIILNRNVASAEDVKVCAYARVTCYRVETTSFCGGGGGAMAHCDVYRSQLTL